MLKLFLDELISSVDYYIMVKTNVYMKKIKLTLLLDNNRTIIQLYNNSIIKNFCKKKKKKKKKIKIAS